MKTNPTNEVLRHNYKDLQDKYAFLFNLLVKIQKIIGHDGRFNDLPGAVKKLKDLAGVAAPTPYVKLSDKSCPFCGGVGAITEDDIDTVTCFKCDYTVNKSVWEKRL